MSNSSKGALYVALCITLWSLIPIFAKLGQSNLDHHQYLFFSSLLSFLALLGVGYYRRELGNLWHYSLQTLLFLAFLGFLDFFYYWLLYFGYKEAQGLEVLVFQYSWPIFIVILSPWFLGEKLSMKHALSLLFGFLGVAVVLSQGKMSEIEFSNFKALFLVLLGAFSFALFSVLSKRVSAKPLHAVTLYFLSATLYSSLALSLFSSWEMPSWGDWPFILVNGIFLNGISYLFWVEALRLGDASKVAPFLFFIPPLSAFWLILFLDEPWVWAYGVGLMLVILSGIINARRKR